MSTPPEADALVAHIGHVKQKGLTAPQKKKLEQNLKARLKRLKTAAAGVEKALKALGRK
jgi:hypothetical protein